MRDGVKQLHLVDVEIGRILLRREGYTGSVEELRRVYAKFGAKVRASFETSGPTCEASLPPPLHVPLECSTIPERKGVKRQSESALVDSPLPIEWKHIPDDAQHDLMRNQRRVLMALSLAAQTSPLPGVAELSVTATAKGTRVQAARPFPAGTLMLLPMVPGHLQVVNDSVHPHRVAVRAGGSVLYLVPCSKITSWPTPFWAVRRTFSCFGE